ncbi:hypothetical protein [Caloramator sp. ALD01]|uniref:hypothetical protein n=1 Tax=Caloramator sp. ALD01 TaxID=1031288 RepID=UPI000420CFE5|nr:hypothetical protein [Caloramator sp. ALD01]
MVDSLLRTIEDSANKLIYSNSNYQKNSWHKLSGDIAVRVLAEFLGHEIDSTKEVSQPNAFIEGCSTEFDLLIVKKGSKPIYYSNCYKSDDVFAALEVKHKGIFSVSDAQKIKDNFDRAKNLFPHINFIYVTISERASVKNPASINYFDVTLKTLNPYPAYCFYDNATKTIRKKDWDDFIRQLK